MAILLAMVARAAAQQQKSPDYASKPLAKWIEALKDKSNWERLEARVALSPAGPYAKTAVPALTDAFKELSEPSEAAQTLAEYGPAVVPNLLKALARPESKVRAGAAEALGWIRPKSATAVSVLIKTMKDPSADVRARAAVSLGRIGPAASQAAPSLVAALQDKQADVREAAARALSKMPREAHGAADVFIPLLSDKEVCVRSAAAMALYKIGPAARAAVPALIEALRDKTNERLRWNFAAALAGIGPAAKAGVPALLAALEEGNEGDDLRRYAALALGHIGPAAKRAVPALLKAASEKDDPDRDAMIFALGKIGPDAKAAVPFLVKALNGKRGGELSWAAANALAGVGPDAKAAVPALTALVQSQDADPQDRQAAAQALAKINPKLPGSKMLDIPTLTVRLGKIPTVKLPPRPALGREREKSIKALIAKLADVKKPDFGFSDTLTGHAFSPLPGQHSLGVFYLTNHRLKTSDALRTLVAIGPDALPFLLNALEDGTPTKLSVTRQIMMGFGPEIEGNPLNKWESQVLSKSWPDEWDGQRDLYTIKVGDLCFVAIGQIVGRQYLAVRYVPTAIVMIGSPVQSDELRERVRTIWSSKDPAKKLLDSLLIDYATEGIYNGESLDGWYDGSDRQIAAAMRLLYYFPKETAPLISARLRSFDVRSRPSDTWADREVKNGVRTADFIKAVSWCQAPGIQEALADIARRTDDETIRKALAPSKSE